MSEIIRDSVVMKRIIEMLEDTDVDFERIDHDPVFTSEDAAKIRDTDISSGAKALVCFADKNPVLVVLPADEKLDFKKFKNEFQVKDFRLASKEEVRELTGLSVGSIPPVGKALGLKSYFDKKFQTKTRVAFNVGAHTSSVVMNASDLLNMEKPVLADLV